MSAEWIADLTLQVFSTTHDRRDPTANPDYQRYLAAYQEMRTLLFDAEEQGRPLTPELIDEVSIAALAAGRRKTASLNAPSRRHTFVPVFPGMTTTDWRSLESQVQQHGDLHLRAWVKSLFAEGMSRAAIAKELGIGRAYVRLLLSPK